MSDFDSIEEVQQILQKLAADEPPYVKQIGKKAGQKEARYLQLFGAGQLEELPEEETLNSAQSSSELEQRVQKLEQELEELKEMVNLLMNT